MFYLINGEIMDFQRIINGHWKEVRWFDKYVTEINFCEAVFRGILGFREEISTHTKYFVLDFTDICSYSRMQRFSIQLCMLYRPDRDLQRRALISVLAGNMEEEMLLTATHARTHTHTHTHTHTQINQKIYRHAVTFSSANFRYAIKCNSFYFAIVKGKGKSVPLQAWTGPEGS